MTNRSLFGTAYKSQPESNTSLSLSSVLDKVDEAKTYLDKKLSGALKNEMAEAKANLHDQLTGALAAKVNEAKDELESKLTGALAAKVNEAQDELVSKLKGLEKRLHQVEQSMKRKTAGQTPKSGSKP